jgi:hypothetical protein
VNGRRPHREGEGSLGSVGRTTKTNKKCRSIQTTVRKQEKMEKIYAHSKVRMPWDLDF